MKKDMHMVHEVCEKLCIYYKPGKKEELACRGFLVAEQLARKHGAPAFEQSECAPDEGIKESVREAMCKKCDFHEQDCDYMQDRTATPCGGFIFITRLLANGTIVLHEIQ